MINVLITGVGGQGTVLAAKVLAQAAQDKGWKVRTAETIGMAQRGGGVVSHVRMGNEGEQVHAPLLARGTADVMVAFEPAEGARQLPFLAPDGLLVCARTAIQPVTAALSRAPYRGGDVVHRLEELFAQREGRMKVVDDAPILAAVGTRRALNMVLLAAALAEGRIPLSVDDLKSAVATCVKPRFVEMNLKAIDTALAG